MKKTYFFLGILILIMICLLGLLIFRAHTNDIYFYEHGLSEESSLQDIVFTQPE